MALFLRPAYINVVIDSLAFCQRQNRLAIHGYVVMPDHLHLIVSGEDLPKTIREFKSFTSRQLVSLLQADNSRLFLWLAQDAARKSGEGHHKVWQDGYHPEQVYSQRFFEQKMNYIHHNPVRRNLVAEPRHWLHSSAEFYSGGIQPSLEIQPIIW